MAKTATLSAGDGLRATINAFLAELLKKQVVEAILVPITDPSGKTVVQSLVTKPEYLDKADVLAPVMPVNSARIVQAMTRLAPAGRKTAIVMRPCELRALVELVKLRQISLENLYLIGFDCPGAYPYKTAAELGDGSTSDAFVEQSLGGGEIAGLRPGCAICEFPAPLVSDLTIGLFGVDRAKNVLLVTGSEKGEELLDGLGLTSETEGDAASQRESAVATIVGDMKKKRDEFFAVTKEEIGGTEKLATVFGPCIKCQNCQTACPVCYCRECFFCSPTFELEADKYLNQAEKRGAVRMPADTLLFHLTRMTHMAASCIGCGACEEACPMDIPLLKIFQLTGSNVQELFEYVPGRSLDDELPPTAFREDEFEWIGEK